MSRLGMHRQQSATSRKESDMASKSLKELQFQNPTDPVERLRLVCLSRGATGILSLGRMFRRMDGEGNKSLNFEEFLKGLRGVGLELTDEEAMEVFYKFDTDEYGYINLDELLVHIRPPLNDTRHKVIEEAFQKMDKNGEGEIEMKALKRCYNVKGHSRYIAGEESEESILQRFLGNFERGATKDGKVTREEFFNYYAAVSASIDNDCYFDLMMRKSYKL